MEAGSWPYWSSRSLPPRLKNRGLEFCTSGGTKRKWFIPSVRRVVCKRWRPFLRRVAVKSTPSEDQLAGTMHKICFMALIGLFPRKNPEEMPSRKVGQGLTLPHGVARSPPLQTHKIQGRGVRSVGARGPTSGNTSYMNALGGRGPGAAHIPSHWEGIKGHTRKSLGTRGASSPAPAHSASQLQFMARESLRIEGEVVGNPSRTRARSWYTVRMPVGGGFFQKDPPSCGLWSWAAIVGVIAGREA